MLFCSKKHFIFCLLHANVCLPIVEQIHTNWYEALTCYLQCLPNYTLHTQKKVLAHTKLNIGPRLPMPCWETICIGFLNILGFIKAFYVNRVPRIENRVSGIRENYYRVSRFRENRVPRIREIGSLQVHTGYLTFSIKNSVNVAYLHLTLSSNWFKCLMLFINLHFSIII